MARSHNALPGILSTTEATFREVFLEQVKLIPGGERLNRCIQCGTCTGSCPVSHAMDLSPRQVIALFRAGDLGTIMKSRTIWICASCYACTTRCPSGIKITDIVYALKRTAMEKNIVSVAPQVQRLARIFTGILMKYGRLHEGTLIRKYYLRTNPFGFLELIPLAGKMWKSKRVALFPRRIREHASLARIIRKAQEIDVRHVGQKPEYAPDYVGYRAVGEMQLEQRQGEPS
jgi:heterodisulfide reductase subunit C